MANLLQTCIGTMACSPIVCATSCVKAPVLCATTDLCWNSWLRASSTTGIYWSAANLLHLYPTDGKNLLLRSNCSSVGFAISTCNNVTPRGYFWADCSNNVGISDYNNNQRVTVQGTSTIWLKNHTCI